MSETKKTEESTDAVADATTTPDATETPGATETPATDVADVTVATADTESTAIQGGALADVAADQVAESEGKSEGQGPKVWEGVKNVIAKVGSSTSQAVAKVGSSTSQAASSTAQAVASTTQAVSGTVRDTVRETVKTIKNVDLVPSRAKKEIVWAETEEGSLEKIKEFIESERVRKSERRPQKWNFATAPLQCFDKTIDDLLMAFVRWAKEPADTKDTENAGKYNITKAFDRLESYATWMDKTDRDMVDPPLTSESVKPAWKKWNMKITVDKEERLVWWFDFPSMDVKEIHELPALESLRLFVWFAHFVLLDPRAQQNGMICVEHLGQSKFWSTVTLVPPQLGSKIDKLTVGTMPVKMKQIYVTGSPKWVQVLMKVMQPFLSKVVKERIITGDDTKILEERLGDACIPTSISGCDGKLEKDILTQTFFSE